jgi:hypothetical protein
MEGALREAGVPLRALLSEAAIDRSTWTRWKASTTGPRLTNWLAVEAAFNRLSSGGFAHEGRSSQ